MANVPAGTRQEHYATALYARMLNDAKIVEGQTIWRGRIVDTCIQLGIPQGGYNRVLNLLRKLECIELIERGFRGDTLTSYRLLKPPTAEAFAESFVKSAPGDLTRRPSLDRLSQTVKDIDDNIGGINIPKALKVLEDRIVKLERQMRSDGTSK